MNNQDKIIEKKENEDNLIDFKKNNIEQLQSQLIDSQKKVKNIQLRQLANIENIKKNAEIKIKKIKNTQTENFFKNIIPLVDSFGDLLLYSRTLQKKDETLIRGIKLTLKSLLSTMCKFGITIEGNINEQFNPKIHHAISIKSCTTVLPNHIIAIKKQGFTFNKILLRKAIVIISK